MNDLLQTDLRHSNNFSVLLLMPYHEVSTINIHCLAFSSSEQTESNAQDTFLAASKSGLFSIPIAKVCNG